MFGLRSPAASVIVAVRPLVASDDSVVSTETTNVKGFYWFDNLPASDYIVEFGASAGNTRTTAGGQIGGNPGGETLLVNSDADATSGRTATITLAAGERNPNIDAGYFVTTLPVKLLYFVGNTDACTVNLKWATATEQNAKSFEVWRSEDGIRYTKIGEVRAAGNSTTTIYYDFTDSKPYRNNYYKLVQIDFDGRSETFTIAGKIATNGCYGEEDNGISGLYPNPNSTEAVTVKFFTDRNDTEDVKFVIHDILGRIVVSETKTITRGANVVNIDITTLPSGTYTVKVIGNGWYSLAQKLVRISE